MTEAHTQHHSSSSWFHGENAKQSHQLRRSLDESRTSDADSSCLVHTTCLALFW